MTPVPPSCPQCGAVLPADAPAGLCPACLMNAAVPTQVDPGATVVLDRPQPRDLPQVGETFGTYRIERELGHGGMGAVFAAEHLESGRRVALKVLSRQLDSPEARARFLREGRLAASINHPNSVYVFGTEEIEGTPVIAMELIAGGTLQERVQRNGPLPVGEAVDAVLQIIAGLEAAQAIGILHRDIKPANCFEDLDGTVKVGDFGLSISTQGRGESHLTLPGDFLGTPAFCSPEQLRGDELNVRSDMYSVGVTLFYLLTGRTPFEGKNMVQLLANALEKTAPSPSQFRSEIPASLSRIVLRCLEKIPASRFASYDELRRALAPFGSTAPTPATLGLRFVAMLADEVVFIVLSWIVMFAMFQDLRLLTDPDSGSLNKWMWYSAVVFAIKLGYWGLLEGRWGASVGKALVGLRVARLNRSAPGVLRAMARPLILMAPTLVATLCFSDYFRAYDATSGGTQWMSFVFIGASLAYELAMFATARRANGFAAVHDLLTGTRVIQRSAYQTRVAATVISEPVTMTADMQKLGPYHVLAPLASRDDETLLLGYDTRLLRKVWIRRMKPGAPPVPQAVRNLGRSGRLRWLQGERSAGDSWDVYEASSGVALVDLLVERQPWGRVRHWLHDFAVELEAASKDDTTPAALSLDRVWITTEGNAKLLDFVAPTKTGVNPECAQVTSPSAFLNQAAVATLEGRIVDGSASTNRTLAVPLPVSARAALQSLALEAPARRVVQELQPLLCEPATIARWKRIAVVLFCALPAIFLGVFCAAGALLMEQTRVAHPEFFPLQACMMMHQEWKQGKKPDSGELSAAEAAAAMEVHIAGKYGHVVRDRQKWTSSMYKFAMPPHLREEAERMVAEHPNPTDEEKRLAAAKLRPYVDRIENPNHVESAVIDTRKFLRVGSTLMVHTGLILVAIPSLVLTMILRRGPLFRIFGIAVVTGEGRDASRLRMLARNAIAWLPAFLFVALLRFSKIKPDELFTLGMVTVVVVVLFAIISLARRRSLQDQLAGTWLVPA